MVVTTSGVLCQQLKLDENFQERRTAFLGFQLLPEVPRAPAARALPRRRHPGRRPTTPSPGARGLVSRPPHSPGPSRGVVARLPPPAP